MRYFDSKNREIFLYEIEEINEYAPYPDYHPESSNFYQYFSYKKLTKKDFNLCRKKWLSLKQDLQRIYEKALSDYNKYVVLLNLKKENPLDSKKKNHLLSLVSKTYLK